MEVQTNPAEAWKALKNSHGSALELLDFQVDEGSSRNLSGHLSNIYTLIGQVRVDGQQSKQIKMKVKKMSEMTFRWKTAVEMGIFEQEIGFFENCIPILLKNCQELPVVKCFKSNLQTRVMFLEDLNDLGYDNVVYNLTDLRTADLKIEHLQLALTTLAKFHAASLGVDWSETLPELFEHDLVHERGGAAHRRRFYQTTVESTALPAARLLFPENQQIYESVQWLSSDECFQMMTSLSKADPKSLNVLNHGDCWINNFLFKIDPETNTPVDAKMIDFQRCKYAPISRDLVQFMYFSTSSEFRKNHESELIHVYVDAFNKNCAEIGRNERVSHEQILREYNQSRLHVLIKALHCCPIIHVQGLIPKDNNGRMTKDTFNKYVTKGHDTDSVMREACKNEEYKKELRSLLEETYAIYRERVA